MKVARLLLAGAAGIMLLLLIWGAGIEPRLIDEEPQVAAIPGLPAAWESRRVAQISDLQVGMWLDNTGTIRRIVERLVAQRPAVVLITGDFIYHPVAEETVRETREELEEDPSDLPEAIDEVVDLVRPLPAAGIPTYAVFGNHDYGMGSPQAVRLDGAARLLRQALEAAGIRVLANEAVALPPPGETPPDDPAAAVSPLYLVGIGSRYAGLDRPAVALAGVPDGAPRIAMMHNPDSFVLFPAGTAPLGVAGHTHGGQIRLPFTDDWAWVSLIRDARVHVDGWIDGYGRPGNRLYVNRGIGFSKLPIRINALPEITVFTLRGARNAR